MVKPEKLLFVLMDGGRARFVERSSANGHYLTIEELDAKPRLESLRRALRASPPGRSMSSASPRRTAVGREDHLRTAKEAFVGEVAERAAEICRLREMAGVVVAAPSRLIGEIQQRLEGRARIAGKIRKDLTKAANSELGVWLDHLFLEPSRPQ